MFGYSPRIAVDERGDTGFKFDEGSSTHFAVALVSVDDIESIEGAAKEARRTLRWPEDREFKFSGTSDAAKEVYFNAIRRASFEVRAVVFDKRRLNPQASKDFYGHLIGLSLQDVIEVVRNKHLVLDESFRGKGKQRAFRSELRARLGQPGGGRVLRDLSYVASHSDDGLQLADMSVGAISRAYTRNDDHHLRMLGTKVVEVRLYP